jgi:serine/threonine protein kinase
MGERMSELVPGRVVANRYRLQHIVGQGGLGVVWAGIDVANGLPVALKFMTGPSALDAVWHKRFYREARAAMAVKHPNVVRIHEIVRDDDGAPVMVMDLLVGESLDARLAREVALPIRTFAPIFLPVISAIGTAHSIGVIHRDLKPANIFLESTSGGGINPRVLDFGIAKLTATEGDAANTAALTSTGSSMGTPLYMAPEQFLGKKDLDHRADVWALGVIIYQSLSGHRPVEGETILQIFHSTVSGSVRPLSDRKPDIPHDIAALTMRMLHVSPAGRPWDLREVAAVLQRYVGSSTIDFAAATLPNFVEGAGREANDASTAPTQVAMQPSGERERLRRDSLLVVEEFSILVKRLTSKLPHDYDWSVGTQNENPDAILKYLAAVGDSLRSDILRALLEEEHTRDAIETALAAEEAVDQHEKFRLYLLAAVRTGKTDGGLPQRLAFFERALDINWGSPAGLMEARQRDGGVALRGNVVIAT